MSESPESNQRAEHLGSSALSTRVRCPCGRKNDFHRARWQWYGVAICRRCGCGILYQSYRLIDAAQAAQMISSHIPTEEELRALRRIELVMRNFIATYDDQPRWLWAPATTQMSKELKPLFQVIDEEREGFGDGTDAEALPGAEDDEAALISAEEEDITDAD